MQPMSVSKFAQSYKQALDTKTGEFKLPRPPLGAFSDIPVLGITEHIAGPVALSTLVADGAIGIGLEPAHGDPARKYLSRECYTTFHAGTLSAVLDLKTDPNYEKLLHQSVVIIDNRSKRAQDADQVLQKFLKDPNKPNRVIYCSILGYPGADAIKAGNDVTVQAAMGIAYVNGAAPGQPLKVGFPVLDFATASRAVIVIQSRFIQMLRGIPIADEVNKVIPIRVTLAAEAAIFACSQFLDAQQGKPILSRNGNQDNFIGIFSFFRTQDEEYISIATLTDQSFKIFCEQVILRPDLAAKYPLNANRIQNKGYIHDEIQKIIETKPRSYWLHKLALAGITCSEVNTVTQAVAKPFAQLLFTQARDGTTMLAPPDGAHRPLDGAPALNQHGAALTHILNSVGEESPVASDTTAASPLKAKL